MLGGGANVSCPDGVLATSCKINNGFSGFDAFISAHGQVYFVDYMGIVRTILADGTVRRVMGQSKGSGDGGLATEARLNNVTWVDQANDGTIFFSDAGEARIRYFSLGGNISPHSKIQTDSNILLNKDNKDIYSRLTTSIQRLDFSTSSWSLFASAATTYETIPNAANEIFGYHDNNKILFGIMPSWTQALGYRDFKLAAINTSTLSIDVLTKYSGNNPVYCAHNTPASACSVSNGANARAQYDTSKVTPRWIMLKSGTTHVVALNEEGQNNNEVMATIATLPKAANSFVYRDVGGFELIDYCATDGRLYSYNITTSTNTAYPWPILSLTCTGRTLNYNSSSDSFIFPAKQNGLSAIIEYKLNP